MIEPQRIIPSDTLYTMVTKMNAIIDTVVSIPGEVTDEIQRELNTKASIQYVDSQIALITADGIPKLASYYYTITSKSDGQTVFNIPLETFDKNTDTLLVFQNTTFIGKNNYVINDNNTFTLNVGVNKNTLIEILILKNVPIGPEGSINGDVIAIDSMSINRVKGLLESLGDIHDETLPEELKGKSLTEQIKQLKKYDDAHKADYTYQTPTIVGTQIRIKQESDSNRLYFKLDNTLIGSSITISLDGGISELPLKDVEGNNVTELEKGFVEVVAEANFFTLRPKGGKKIDDVDYTITSQGGQFFIPKGQHSGNGIVKAQFANLVPENIKNGVNIGNIVGSFMNIDSVTVLDFKSLAPNESCSYSLPSNRTMLIVQRLDRSDEGAIIIRDVGFFKIVSRALPNFEIGVTNTTITIKNIDNMYRNVQALLL